MTVQNVQVEVEVLERLNSAMEAMKVALMLVNALARLSTELSRDLVIHDEAEAGQRPGKENE